MNALFKPAISQSSLGHWDRRDMTRDGAIDINHMVMVGQHWLSCWTPSLTVPRPASACDWGAVTQMFDDIPLGFAYVSVLIDE